MTSDSTASDSTDTSVVVIGGGQAGLSVSYYLKRLGLDPGNEFVVLDRGPGTGGAWQFRWDALRIGSAHRINDLPGMDEIGISFSTADRTMPAKDVVADYYAQYEEHYGFQIVRSAAVSRVENAGDRMLVTFSDGQGEQVVSTDIVINATGTWGSPFIPWYPGRDSFAGRHVHTAEYADAAEFAGQKVVVVGGGTSAIGFLLELESVAASTTWVSRRPIEFLEDGELNLEARVSAVAMQDEAARAGRALPSIVSGTGVPRTRRIQAGIDRGLLAARPMFASIEPGGVRWSNGSFQEADAIIWSTGFRPELRHLAPLKLREREGGIIVAGGSSWKEPRIFFAGYGPQASTIGANRAGRSIARQAVATLSRLKRIEREERDAREEQQRLEERMRQNAVDSEAARAAAFVAAAEAERAAADAVAAAAAVAAQIVGPAETPERNDSPEHSDTPEHVDSPERVDPPELVEPPALIEPPARYPAFGEPEPEREAAEAATSDESPVAANSDQSPDTSDAPSIELVVDSTGHIEVIPTEPPAADFPWMAPADSAHRDSSTASVWPLATGYPVPAPDPAAVPAEVAETPADLSPDDAEVLAHIPEFGDDVIVIDDPDSLTMAELLEHINAPEGMAMPESEGDPEYRQSPEWEVGTPTPALPEPVLPEPALPAQDPPAQDPPAQDPPTPVSASSSAMDAPHWFTDDHAPSFFDDVSSSAPAPESEEQPEQPHFRSSFSPPEPEAPSFRGTFAAPEPDDHASRSAVAESEDEPGVPHFRSSFSPPEAEFPSFFQTLSLPNAEPHDADAGNAADGDAYDPDGDTNELTPGTPRRPRH